MNWVSSRSWISCDHPSANGVPRNTAAAELRPKNQFEPQSSADSPHQTVNIHFPGIATKARGIPTFRAFCLFHLSSKATYLCIADRDDSLASFGEKSAKYRFSLRWLAGGEKERGPVNTSTDWSSELERTAGEKETENLAQADNSWHKQDEQNKQRLTRFRHRSTDFFLL